MEKELYQTDKKIFEANKDEQVKIESTRVESNDYHPPVVANRCGWCGGWRWSHNKGERCGWWLVAGRRRAAGSRASSSSSLLAWRNGG